MFKSIADYKATHVFPYDFFVFWWFPINLVDQITSFKMVNKFLQNIFTLPEFDTLKYINAPELCPNFDIW